jgi:hypothetical protein
MPIAKNLEVNRAEVEQEFVQETRGKLLASTVEVKGGVKYLRMTAHRTVPGDESYISVVLVADKGKTYKAGASSETDHHSNPDVTRFLSSLKSVDPIPPLAQQPAPERERSATDRFAQLVGGIGCLLLFVCGLVYLAIRIGKRPKPKPRRRRRNEDDEDENEEDDSRDRRPPSRRPRRDEDDEDDDPGNRPPRRKPRRDD